MVFQEKFEQDILNENNLYNDLQSCKSKPTHTSAINTTNSLFFKQVQMF